MELIEKYLKDNLLNLLPAKNVFKIKNIEAKGKNKKIILTPKNEKNFLMSYLKSDYEVDYVNKLLKNPCKLQATISYKEYERYINIALNFNSKNNLSYIFDYKIDTEKEFLLSNALLNFIGNTFYKEVNKIIYEIDTELSDEVARYLRQELPSCLPWKADIYRNTIEVLRLDRDKALNENKKTFEVSLNTIEKIVDNHLYNTSEAFYYLESKRMFDFNEAFEKGIFNVNEIAKYYMIKDIQTTIISISSYISEKEENLEREI